MPLEPSHRAEAYEAPVETGGENQRKTYLHRSFGPCRNRRRPANHPRPRPPASPLGSQTRPSKFFLPHCQAPLHLGAAGWESQRPSVCKSKVDSLSTWYWIFCLLLLPGNRAKESALGHAFKKRGQNPVFVQRALLPFFKTMRCLEFFRVNTGFQELRMGLPRKTITSLSRGDRKGLAKKQIGIWPPVFEGSTNTLQRGVSQSFRAKSQLVSTGQTKVKPISLLNTKCSHHSGLVNMGLSSS